MATPSSDNVLLGRGSIYFDRFDANGVKTGFRHLGNCDQFSIANASEKLEMDNYLQQTKAKYASVITSTDNTITIGGFEFDTENLALMSLGTTSTYTQAATAVVDEVLLAATATNIKGKYLKTAKMKITSVVLKQGATTLVLGTDYAITDAANGIIQLLSTSVTVVDGTVITVSYTPVAIVSGADVRRVAASVLAECNGQLMFVSNNTTGQNRIYQFWKVSMIPNGELAAISDEFAKFTLTATVLDDSAGLYGGSVSEPYYIIQDKAA